MENSLLKLKGKIDKELNEFFDDKIKQAEKWEEPEEFLEMVKNLKRFTLSGGKRIRPIFFYYGYLIAGGEKREDIIKAAISIELIHSYFLIHDDIIDEDDFRRYNPSMHCVYERKYKDDSRNNYKKRHFGASGKNSAKHFGVSMAILTGDLASSLGYKILNYSNFSADLKNKATEKLNKIILNTIIGEAMDVVLASRLNANLNDVVKMQRYKTAKYTIEGPLHLGAILAGANKKFLKSISDFAIPLGIAFQIQDDIIGVFGNKERIGKPIGVDIEEGKKTLLLVKALERVDKEQLKVLSKSFGNRDISLNEVNVVRKIIKETGSLEYSLEKIKDLTKFSKARLEEIEISEKYKKCLLRLADFMAGRKY